MSARNFVSGIVPRAPRAWAAVLLFGALPLLAEKPNVSTVGRLVVVGDSLSAGFQNFSLFDSPTGGQSHGYAALVAAQAGVPLLLPLISYPGIPPALTLVGPGQISRAMGIGAREFPNQAYDLSVPGFTVANALAYPYPGNPTVNAIDAMSDNIFLPIPNSGACGPFGVGSAVVVSEVACAVQLHPQTILVSIGNNDALQALTSGALPTDEKTFAQQYALLLAGLSATHAQIFVANIPDVTAIPFLVPVPAFKQICQSSPLPMGTQNADFVVLNIENPNPPMIFSLCNNYVVRSAALIEQTQDAVVQFNRIIATEARAFDATVVDINGLFAQLSKKGYPLTNKKVLTTAFLGGLFSLDGIHPTNTGYAILANETIKTINKEFHSSIPLVSVDQVAAVDPLIFP
jgi:lysophospholipase L1-like esterase